MFSILACKFVSALLKNRITKKEKKRGGGGGGGGGVCGRSYLKKCDLTTSKEAQMNEGSFDFQKCLTGSLTERFKRKLL